MNEFKVNVYCESKNTSFQSIMNELFIIFIKEKLIATCNDSCKELSY